MLCGGKISNMKLIKCYVSSFGKLKDFSFDFSDGINTFKEDNGWGKSTLATFIKAMFYGLNGTGKRSVAENERLKYKPWNSTETFGGYVEFFRNGKSFRIERYFGNKDSEDTVKLTDLETGKVFSSENDLGKRIFEIDEEGFLSTTYFSQRDFQIKSNTSLTAKYNAICEIQDSDAFDRAVEKVENKAKTYKYRGDKGLIPDTKRLINSISEDIESLNHSLDTVKFLRDGTEKLENDVAVLKVKTDELSRKIAKAGEQKVLSVKKERYDELSKEYKAYLTEKQDVDARLNNKVFSDVQINRSADYAKEILSIDSVKNLLTAEISNIANELQTKKRKKKPKTFTVIMSIITAIFFLGGAIELVYNTLVGIGVLAGGLISLAVLLYSIFAKKKDDTSVALNQMLEQKKRQFIEFAEKGEKYSKWLDEFFSGVIFPDEYDYSQKVMFVKELSHQSGVLDSKIKNLLSTLEQLKPMAMQYVFDAKEGLKLEDLKEQLDNVQKQYSEKANALAEKKAGVRRYEENAEKLADLESKRVELIQNLQTYQDDFDVLTKTSQFLNQANDNLKIKYRAPLQESLNKYLSLIDDDKCAQIDIDLNVTALEKNGEKSTEYYSKGYQNLFEICKRFALVDVLFTGEKPFIMLDDPFYNLDDEKLNSSLELIKKLSEEYQILYFVCHESRRV